VTAVVVPTGLDVRRQPDESPVPSFHVTVPPTDSERVPALGAPPAAGPVGLPRRPATLPVRQRNRVSLDTLEATFAGLQQIDDTARPATPRTPPPDLWPPVTGAQSRVTG